MSAKGARARKAAAVIAELEQFDFDGFVPFFAWRSAEARLESMEHAMRAKIARGVRLCRITRREPLPEWAR